MQLCVAVCAQRHATLGATHGGHSFVAHLAVNRGRSSRRSSSRGSDRSRNGCIGHGRHRRHGRHCRCVVICCRCCCFLCPVASASLMHLHGAGCVHLLVTSSLLRSAQ